MERLTTDPEEAKFLAFATRRDKIDDFSDSRANQVCQNNYVFHLITQMNIFINSIFGRRFGQITKMVTCVIALIRANF